MFNSNDINNKNLQRALALHQSEQIEQAQELYLQILKDDPNNTDALHLLGILMAQQGNYQQACEFLEHALAINPADAQIHNSMGNVLNNLQNFERALYHYQEALKSHPQNPVLHNNIGSLQQKLKNLSAAISHYRQAIALKNDYSDAHYNLGLALMQTNELTEAAAHLNAVLQLNPKHSRAYDNLAQIYQQRNEDAAAINHYQKSLRLNCNNATAHNNLGGLLLKKNKTAAAINHLKKTLQLDPVHREAFYNLGVAFLKQNDPAAALKYFLRLSQLGKDFDVLYNLGVIYNLLGKNQDALLFFNEALQLDPLHFATQSNLGTIYLRMQDYENAKKHYQQALQIKPHDEEISYILTALKNDQNAGLPQSAPAPYIKHLFDEYAPNYNEHLKLLEYQTPQLLKEAISTSVASEIPYKGWNILDLGCGTGLCGKELAPFAKTMIGIDLAEKMLEIAKKTNVYTKLECGTIETLLPRYEQLDLITAADTLVYSGNLEPIFALVKNALKPCGLFAFNLESTSCESYVLQRTLRYAHNNKYIIELAKACGFKCIYRKAAPIRKHNKEVVAGEIYVLQA